MEQFMTSKFLPETSRFPNGEDFNGIFRHKTMMIKDCNDSMREAENCLVNNKQKYKEQYDDYLSYW